MNSCWEKIEPGDVLVITDDGPPEDQQWVATSVLRISGANVCVNVHNKANPYNSGQLFLTAGRLSKIIKAPR